MKWFLVILLAGNNEGFLWYDPVFETSEQCTIWANNNPVRIIHALNYYYDDWQIKSSLCVREDRLQDLNIKPYVEGQSL